MKPWMSGASYLIPKPGAEGDFGAWVCKCCLCKRTAAGAGSSHLHSLSWTGFCPLFVSPQHSWNESTQARTLTSKIRKNCCLKQTLQFEERFTRFGTLVRCSLAPSGTARLQGSWEGRNLSRDGAFSSSHSVEDCLVQGVVDVRIRKTRRLFVETVRAQVAVVQYADKGQHALSCCVLRSGAIQGCMYYLKDAA